MARRVHALAPASLFRTPLFRTPRTLYQDIKKELGIVKKRFNQYPLLISPHVINFFAVTKGLVLQDLFRAPGKRFNQDPLLISINGYLVNEFYM